MVPAGNKITTFFQPNPAAKAKATSASTDKSSSHDRLAPKIHETNTKTTAADVEPGNREE
jgi:hypothetical protein